MFSQFMSSFFQWMILKVSKLAITTTTTTTTITTNKIFMLRNIKTDRERERERERDFPSLVHVLFLSLSFPKKHLEHKNPILNIKKWIQSSCLILIIIKLILIRQKLESHLTHSLLLLHWLTLSLHFSSLSSLVF